MRDVQFHPVKDYPMHVDFFRVLPGKPVAIDVPVKIVGNSEGVKLGGKLTVQKRKLRISGLVENLPDFLEVDITNLGIGKATTSVCAVIMTRAARGAAAAAAAGK